MVKRTVDIQVFAGRIKQLRLDNKLTQKQMAQVLGINERTYQNFEARRYLPSHTTMLAIIDHFGLEAYKHLIGLPADLSESSEDKHEGS